MKKYSKVKREAIDIYNKRIKYGEKQPKGKEYDYDADYTYDESFTFACPYCLNSACHECNLNINMKSCCNGLYVKMRDSKTWGTWVKRAKLVREYIRKHG